MNGSTDGFVTMTSGLVLPIEVLRLAWDLENRGLTLGVDGDVLVVGPRERLTDADRESIRRWKNHLLAVASSEQTRQ